MTLTITLLALAAKSLLVAGCTLLLLRIAARRSAAERSWLAHAGLVATLLLPLAPLAGLGWRIEAPAAMAGLFPGAAPPAAAGAPEAGLVRETIQARPAAPVAPAPVAAPGPPLSAGAVVGAGYIAVAAALLFGTFVGVLRLVALRRRSQVLVAQGWLTALARAQNRMGFKHGTALLVSDDLGSPVSWGVLRPVIVLNRAAVAAEAEAEAIIAHELAHVARLDWAKLMLSRVATALFWFNPFVWRLAAHCHQLREEAADDAVLGTEVGRLDYAQLLVGVARHDGPMLLAANGVASGADSLKRRVARVLDAGLSRAPARSGWVSACAAGALIAAVPLAAMSLHAPVPPRPARPPAAPRPPAPLPAAAPRPSPAPRPVMPPAPPAPAAHAAHFAAEARQAAAEARADARAEARGEARTDADADADARADARFDAEADLAEPISGISVRGGGTVIVRPGPTERVRVLRGAPGSFRITRRNGSLQLYGCLAVCPAGAAEIEVTVADTTDIALATMGGGTITARGSFPRQTDLAAATMNGGLIDAAAIPASDVAAAVRGGGAIHVAPRETLAASITGGGTISYTGDPEVASQVRGGGTVRRVGGRPG